MTGFRVSLPTRAPARGGWRRSMLGAVMGAATLLSLGAADRAAAGDITIWHNYGTEVNATALGNVVDAFSKAHPDIKVNLVNQPADNYFALLTAASIAHKAPDIAVMWTGLFAIKYAHLLADLRPLLPKEPLAEMKGLQWASEDFDLSKKLYVLPLEDQFYIGFYNKALLKKAGIDAPPRDWAELADACTKLRAAGITPLLYGSDSQALSSEFYPFYDFSYLMAGVYPVEAWTGFASGKIPWTQFDQGKAAMIVDGNWNLQQLSDKLGPDLGVFPLPYSDAPMKGVVQMPGDGLSILKSSTNKQDAATFLTFLMSGEAQQILSKTGLIPGRQGYAASNPLYVGLLALSSQGFTKYPMIDNVIQGELVDTGQRVLNAAFAGQMKVSDAMQKMQDTWNNLPADEKK